MTLEEMTRFAELQIQLRNERERNAQLLRELDRIIQGDIWVEIPNPLLLPHIKIDLCISRRAIMECKTLGQESNLAHSIFGQAQKLIERAING